MEIELAESEFGAVYHGTEKKYAFTNPNTGREIELKDCICDAFLQNILLKPQEYDVIATLNLNGDYVSDALAACVGGIGISQELILTIATVKLSLKLHMGPHPTLPEKISLIPAH